MNIILLQGRLNPQEITHLLTEFPQYEFITHTETSYKKIAPEQWSQIEVVYGSRLTSEELALARRLHWIHSPGPYLHQLCLDAIEKRGNILLTTTQEENITQIGEFAMSGILAFAKNLFQWKEANRYPKTVWDSKLRDSLWTLQGRRLLQIGLGQMGTEIARRASQWDLKVWGVQDPPSFNPYCQKTFGMQDLDSLLPQADIVGIALPRTGSSKNFFTKEQLNSLKEDCILLILGSGRVIDEDALWEVAQRGKLRGIIFDAYYQTPIPPISKLWDIPNILITPEIAPRPKTTPKQALGNFRYNLRQFSHNNYKDMRNLISF